MLKIIDKREGAPPPAEQVRKGDLFHLPSPKGDPMPNPTTSAGVPMIAVVGFSPGQGTVRRWTRFTERARVASRRIKSRQAMEDVTTIGGLTMDHARKLSRAGVLTFDALADVEPEQLEALGFDSKAVAAVEKWAIARLAAEIAEEEEVEKLTDIDGVGPKTADVLGEAGIDSHEALLAVPEEALRGLEDLIPATLEAILDWRAENGVPREATTPAAEGGKGEETKMNTEAEARENKAAGPAESKEGGKKKTATEPKATTPKEGK